MGTAPDNETLSFETDFGITNIYGSDVVTGIEVTIKLKDSSTGSTGKMTENIIQLHPSGHGRLGQNKASGAYYPQGSTMTRVFGGPTDNWGIDWVTVKPNDIKLFTEWYGYNDQAGDVSLLEVDHISIKFWMN